MLIFIFLGYFSLEFGYSCILFYSEIFNTKGGARTCSKINVLACKVFVAVGDYWSKSCSKLKNSRAGTALSVLLPRCPGIGPSGGRPPHMRAPSSNTVGAEPDERLENTPRDPPRDTVGPPQVRVTTPHQNHPYGD